MNFPKSFFANGLHCGIKKNSNNDLSVFYSYKPCIAAGMFTTNIFRAAPVIVSEKNIKNKIYAIIANSGCANACTGERGIKDAMAMCEMTAKKINVKAENVLVASTGVIGQFLPINKIDWNDTEAKTVFPDIIIHKIRIFVKIRPDASVGIPTYFK